MTGLPISPGDHGDAVRDLQSRLSAVGFSPDERDGEFGPLTEAALRSFQEHRGLHVDGVCGEQSWSSLVEAGYQLGDRLLYHRSPMLRGDDVEQLQSSLDALGFDPHWHDGIFGELTARAVSEFQRNCGLTTDGICGPDTVAAIRRLGNRALNPGGVALVRQREALRAAPRQLRGRRVALGHDGSLGALVSSVERTLFDDGAAPITLTHPDPSVRARLANEYQAEVYLGFTVARSTEIAFYRSASFESTGGRRLAELTLAHLPPELLVRDDAASASGNSARTSTGVQGLRLPILRETRMPAIECQLGPPEASTRLGPVISTAICGAIVAWSAEPLLDA